MHYVDIGTPNYTPAPNYNSIVFRSRSDADPASPSRGISIPSFFEEGFDEQIEAADDTPFALTPLGEVNSIELEFHVRSRYRLSLGATLTATAVAWLPALFRPVNHRISHHKERALHAPSHLALRSWAGYRTTCNPFRQDGTGQFSLDPALKFTNAIYNPSGRLTYLLLFPLVQRLRPESPQTKCCCDP